MNSVWSSLLPSQNARTNRAESESAISAPSIWSHVPVSATAAPPAVADADGRPASQLFHPRYVPGDKAVHRRMQQTRVKPLQVAGTYGGAGDLSERPVYEHELWGDSTRRRLPHGPDAARLRTHDTDGRAIFDITPAPEPAAAAQRSARPLLSHREQARYDGPPPPDQALAALRLTNPATHVPQPGQLLPFATLMASVRPHPLSDAGFRPLVVGCVADKWQRTLGVPAQQQSEQHSELRPQQPKEDADESQQSRAEQARDAIRHDMATSPMGAPRRAPLLSNDERHTYSIALSPHRPHSGGGGGGGSDRDAAGRPHHSSLDSHTAGSAFEFPAAPQGTNPDAHLAQQAERLHKYSVRALKEQLAELRGEERALDKAQRASDKAALVSRWEEAVGLPSVREGGGGGADGDGGARDGPSADDEAARGRYVFALDDEQEAATQTDVTLTLQHAWKPRVGARSKNTVRDQGPPSEKQRIDAEVAAEYAQKAAATFGVRLATDKDSSTAVTVGVAAAKPAGASTLPRFQSHADAYRAQLQEQYRVIFEAQVAATQQDPRAGELIEARLKRLRDDTLFMSSHRAAAAATAGGKASQRRPGMDGEESEEKKKAVGEDDALLPDTVIGSRTAALLFLDPQMMRRQAAPQHQAASPPNPATGDVPSRVVELTQRAEAALEAQLGFAVPQPTFPGDAAATHRPLQFAAGAGSNAANANTAANAAANASAGQESQTGAASPSHTLAPEVEVLFQSDTGASELDHFGLFAGRPPLVALKHECVELDADVARLENTIRALHAEFAAPRQEAAAQKPPPPGTHPIVGHYDQDDEEKDEGRHGPSKDAPLTAAEKEEHRRLEAAQKVLEQMDHVLGLSPQPQRQPQRSLRSPRHTEAASGRSVPSSPLARSGSRPGAFGFGMAQKQQQQQQRQSRSTASTLVAALEQYLSIDMGAGASLFPAAAANASGSLVAQTASVQSFAAPSLNRPDEFTPQSLSPSFAKTAAAAATAATAGSSSAAALGPHKPQGRVADSWEEEEEEEVEELQHRRNQGRAQSQAQIDADAYADADEREQRQVESMLYDQQMEQMRLARSDAGPQRIGSAGPAAPSIAASRRSSGSSTRPLTPGGGGVRSSFASLSRVSESDHEDSRSYSSGGGLSSARSQQHRRHGTEPPSARVGLSLPPTARGGVGALRTSSTFVDVDSSSGSVGVSVSGGADDSHLWADPDDDADDTSMVMQVQPPPALPYDDDSMDASAGADFRHPRRAPTATATTSHISPRRNRRHDAVLSPSAAQKRRSPEPLPLSPRAQQAIQPRSNRAMELRKAQLLQQEADARDQGRGRSAVSPRSLHPNAARPRSGIELERERRRQKQLHGAGMVQASHERAGEWRAAAPLAGPSVSASPATAVGRGGGGGVTGRAAGPGPSQGPRALSASNDRLMREAQDMMAQFRQQLDSMPDLPDEHEHGHQQQQQRADRRSRDRERERDQDARFGLADEFRPDVHEESWEQQLLQEAHPHDRSDGPRGYEPPPAAHEEDVRDWFAPAPAVELSWEQELAQDSSAYGHAHARTASARNPLDDLSDDDDLFR